MENVENIFFALALASVFWGIVSSIKIVSFLMDRGRKINFFLIRLLIIKYVHDYQVITTEENGQPGFWFYSYVTAMNLALVLAIIGLIIR
jgi:hypothetical protein